MVIIASLRQDKVSKDYTLETMSFVQIQVWLFKRIYISLEIWCQHYFIRLVIYGVIMDMNL